MRDWPSVTIRSAAGARGTTTGTLAIESTESIEPNQLRYQRTSALQDQSATEVFDRLQSRTATAQSQEQTAVEVFADLKTTIGEVEPEDVLSGTTPDDLIASVDQPDTDELLSAADDELETAIDADRSADEEFLWVDGDDMKKTTKFQWLTEEASTDRTAETQSTDTQSGDQPADSQSSDSAARSSDRTTDTQSGGVFVWAS